MLGLDLNKNSIIMLDKSYWPERFVGISISEERLAVCLRGGGGGTGVQI